ncbi:MAG: zinc ribbon domain-containing protein [Ruminococcus sp.]|nr:zinc ribbon domain-containing protein [Ruminococcus sp.]
MVCPKCKSEITEDTDFCGICGAKLIDGVFDESESAEPRRHNKRELHKKSRHNLIKKLKIAGVAAAVLAVAVGIIVVVSSLRTSEGRKIADNVPLGRNIEIVNSDTGVMFDRYSRNTIMPEIGTFSYIYESEENLSVDGIKLPEWAVMISANTSGNIYKKTYYDFTVLGNSWKGTKKSAAPDTETIEYGSRVSDAQKILGLKPYAVVTTLDDNTQKLIYRTHAEDENGNVRVYNINLFVNEADGTVKDVSVSESDYVSFYFSVS